MLIGQPNAEELADEIIRRGLNVRQVEAIARATTAAAQRPAAERRKDADTAALEKRLSDALGLTSRSTTAPSRHGADPLRTLEQLDQVVRRLEAPA